MLSSYELWPLFLLPEAFHRWAVQQGLGSKVDLLGLRSFQVGNPLQTQIGLQISLKLQLLFKQRIFLFADARTEHLFLLVCGECFFCLY